MAQALLDLMKEKKHNFSNSEDLKPLIDKLKDKKVVMLGEASHGTHEYYKWRARITKILMEEHGFDFIGVEGDWPPLYDLNRKVKTYENSGEDIHSVLKNIKRWPAWMWSNWEVEEFSNWLKDFNKNLSANKRKGFYGLDVYSLWQSLDAVMDYLKKEDPKALETAKKAMRCFEPHRDEDGQRYAQSTYLVPEGCRKEVTEMLTTISLKKPEYNTDEEHVFSTEQNALIAKNAEEYYRVMVTGGASTWNLRDKHMMDSLERLVDFHGEDSKAIVWAHNTHIGDASYTDMADSGLYNIGELAREKYGKENVSLVGLGSYKGTVTAGDNWGSKLEEMRLPEGRPGSWEEICHNSGKQFFIFSEDIKNHPELQVKIGNRAVGVVYHPERERFGNYVPTNIPKRYDAFMFFDDTRALDAIKSGEDDKMPDTYPFGL